MERPVDGGNSLHALTNLAMVATMQDTDFIAAAKLSDVPVEGVLPVRVGGLDILICRHEGVFYAIENRCSHADMPLECGRVKFGWISCPAHGARFDLETGEALGPPATQPIRTFAVQVEGDEVCIAVPILP
jgi:3-phenylpropionate/trans-cinnamate dioxygenase ferredoxin component